MRSEHELSVYGEDVPAAGTELGLAASVTGANTEGPRGELSARGLVALDGESAGLEALVGLRVPVGGKAGGSEFYVLGGPGLGKALGTPTFRLLAGFAFGPAGLPAALDADKDGVPDAADACPQAAGPVEGKGCPDTDGDGVVDAKDQCPTVKGTLEGCPDRDADGVVDARDNCPDVAGAQDNAGCPAEQKQKVAITEGKLEIMEKVYFDTGRATVQRRSLPLLDQVAQVLEAHPELQAVTVEGHTDNTGSAQTNLTLSQKRADEVKRLLVQRGVEAERLTAKGFGPARPVQSNDTAAGRDANRRVEFTLGEQPQQEQPQQEPRGARAGMPRRAAPRGPAPGLQLRPRQDVGTQGHAPRARSTLARSPWERAGGWETSRQRRARRGGAEPRSAPGAHEGGPRGTELPFREWSFRSGGALLPRRLRPPPPAPPGHAARGAK